MAEGAGFLVVIPARHGSSRLPGKPLLDIAGKPMIRHVYERAAASGADEVVVATDDERIRDACAAFGAAVCMTDPGHASGTERIAEVLSRRGEADSRVVVNVQGDEPLLPPALVAQVAGALAERPGHEVATLCEVITDGADLHDPGVVKVVRDARGDALYFSRAPVPWHRDVFARAPDGFPGDTTYYRHLGLYAYRAGYLATYVSLEVTQAERAESLEQLRVLHHGGRIHVALAQAGTGPGVDSEADLARVRALVEADAGEPEEGA